MGAEPEPWRPEDTMLIGRLLMFSFAANWDTELLRERLRSALGAERASLLDPAYEAHRATHTGEPYPGSAERLLHAYHSAQAAGLPAGVASNSWAVSGERSATGSPLLASDPHVETRLPSLFHVSHVQGGSFDAIGADIAGVPGIAIGHTRTLAWGLTAGMADVADCFVETIDPMQRDRYQTPQGWQTAERRVERIDVRGEATVEEVVLTTRHGPVIEPPEPGDDRMIALRCTALEDGDLAEAFFGMLAARTVDDMHRVIDSWAGSTFGFVYAHVDGAIGQRLAGSIPRRAPGDGLLPTDGATSPGPSAVRPGDELPALLDPPRGFVVAANNAPGADATLGDEWCEPWRAERITALLEGTPRHNVASFEAIQTDRHSEALSSFRDLLLDRVQVEPGAAAVLTDWDGILAPDSAGAALVETAYRELARDLVERVGGAPGLEVIGETPAGVAAQTSFDYRLQGWVLGHAVSPRRPAFDGAADRDRALRGAVERAVEDLTETQGGDPGEWAWGTIHQLRFDHTLASLPVIGSAFSRGSVPIGGDMNTIWQASKPISRDRATHVVGPAYRQVIDLADFDRSTFQVATGLSGIPGHPRYDDSITEFLDGQTRPLLYTREAIAEVVESELTIEPEVVV